MTEWERVGLRVQANKLRRWDAVCTPKDPDLSEEEFPNNYPHLYDDRSKLIREAVEELIARETGDLEGGNGEVNIDTGHIEEQIGFVSDDTEKILEIIQEIQSTQNDIKQGVASRTDEITDEITPLLPDFDTSDFFTQTMAEATDTSQFSDPHPDRANKYGHWRDVAKNFPDYSDGEVLDALDKITDNIWGVKEVQVDGYHFYINTNE